MLDYGMQQPPRFSPLMQFAILCMLCGIGLVIGSFVSLGIVKAYLHVPLTQLQEALLKSENANLSRILQVVTTLFFMALPAFVFALIMKQKPFQYIGFNSAISGKQVFIVVGIVVMCLILSEALSEVNQIIPITKNAAAYFKQLEDEYNKQMLAIANIQTLSDYIISLFIIALLPALFEEMLFRGTLQPIMISATKNAFAGILITSILFSAIHMSYYGFLPRLALGLIIGYVYYFSKNIWLSVTTHFLYNAFGVTQLYALSKRGLLNSNAVNDSASFPVYYGLFAAVALYITFMVFKRESEVVISMHNLKS